jgi:glycosyltransferase involved in cell wall biosynthesis
MSVSPAVAESRPGPRRPGPRVALVAPSPGLGSYPLAAMLARGCDLHLIAGSEHDPTPRELALAAVHSARVQPLATWRHFRSPNRRERMMVARTIELAPALLHLSSLALARDWTGVARAIGAPLVISVSAEEAAIVALDGSMAPPPGSRLHVDDEQVAALLAEGPVEASTITVIAPAADPRLLAEPILPPPEDTAMRILSIGPLSWTHGYEHALVAVKLLLEAEFSCRYRIVGAGAHYDAIVFARHQLGLDKQVELVEPRSATELREQLRWATVLVDASVIATSPQPELDAHAAGVPVVRTRAHARDHEHEDAAVVVERRDPRGLADALAELAAGGEPRAGLVAAGRKRALTEPGPDEQAARFDELYSKAARRG